MTASQSPTSPTRHLPFNPMSVQRKPLYVMVQLALSGLLLGAASNVMAQAPAAQIRVFCFHLPQYLPHHGKWLKICNVKQPRTQAVVQIMIVVGNVI